MAEHEINTIINVEARAKGSGAGSLGSVSKQLTNIANLTRVLRSSKELKDLPTVFADAHKHASAFVGSLGGVNKQLEQTVAHLKSLKGMGGVVFGAPAAPGAGAQAVVSAAGASTTAAAQTGKGKGGRPKAAVSASLAAAQQAREKAKIVKLEAAALRDMAQTEALEYRAGQHLQTASKTNPANLPPEEGKAARQRERDHRKGYEKFWADSLKEQERQQKEAAKADKAFRDERAKRQKIADREAAAAKKKVEREEESTRKKAARKEEKEAEKRAARNAKVDQELDMFESGFEGRVTRRKQEAKKKRRGAFRQGFVQGIGGPQFLQRDLTMSQFAGYAGGATLRGGAILGGRLIGVGAAGGMGGAGDMIQAIGGLGRGVPALEGIAAAIGAALGRAYQASQQALDFRRASNDIFLGTRLGFAANRGSVPGVTGDLATERGRSMFSAGFRAYTDQFGTQPLDETTDAEQFRRQFEEERAAEARRFASRLGLGATEYLQRQRAFGRVAGPRAEDVDTTFFPTALGVSRVTGLSEEIAGRLAQKLIDDKTFTGASAEALRGLTPAARLDRMTMSPFVQAIRDGLNESDALEVLQDISQQTLKGANLQLGSNAFMATMSLASSLSKTGAVSPKMAYDITRGALQKSQNLAFGAKTSSDLLFLKFFGDLNLGGPISPLAYNTAIERVAQQQNLSDPKRMEKMLRFFMSRMGGDPETAAAAVSGEVNRMFESQVLDVGGARRLLRTIAGGKGLTKQDLSAAGAVLPGLQLAEQTVGFAEAKKADTANREVLAGRRLLDSMQKLDEATARVVETVATFDKEIGMAADLIMKFGTKVSETIQMLNDPQKAAADAIKNVFGI